jgi:hypothetical protein
MHIMLDLETLGTKPGCVILSIGAVAFDTKVLRAVFSRNISLRNSMENGFTIAPATLEWWTQQDPEAIKAWTLNGMSLIDTLNDFASWLGQFDIEGMWGKGSDFDNAILGEAYDRMIGERPWPFWTNRCFRTIAALYKLPKVEPEGTKHVAVNDAVAQARQLLVLFDSQNLTL